MRVVITFLFVFAFPMTAHAVEALPTDGYRKIPVEQLAACKHYANRARFITRDRDAGLEVALADGCSEALRDLYVRIHTSPYAKRRAETFLDRVVALKSTIIKMNMERVYGVGYGRRSQPKAPNRLSIEQRPMGNVSRYGEYLIARQMGVITAYRAWAWATGFESAALH